MTTKLQILQSQLGAEGLCYPAKDLESLVLMFQQENPELNYPSAFMIKRYALELVMREITQTKKVITYENPKN